MLITVERFTSNDDATLSLVKVDGEFVCFGLEDEYREQKVAGETRIPAGEYHVTLRKEGGFHGRYSRKFPDFHKGMLWIRDVPNFEWILIHVGNTDEHTAGCLLVGTGAMAAPGDYTVQASVAAYKRFYSRVVEAAERDDLRIAYVDLDRG